MVMSLHKILSSVTTIGCSVVSFIVSETINKGSQNNQERQN